MGADGSMRAAQRPFSPAASVGLASSSSRPDSSSRPGSSSLRMQPAVSERDAAAQSSKAVAAFVASRTVRGSTPKGLRAMSR